VKIDSELVGRVAKLASLSLSADETDAMARQLTAIVEHFDALKDVPADLLGGSAEAPATPLREDVAVSRHPGVLVSTNAPEESHGHFVVPRVVTRA
jgi:aspartyl/glutamyl-tRNA(Asn/Gln) amidotransferase C subunit